MKEVVLMDTKLEEQRRNLVELKKTLGKAVKIAVNLECLCEDGFTCGKHVLVNSLINARDIARAEANSLHE